MLTLVLAIALVRTQWLTSRGIVGGGNGAGLQRSYTASEAVHRRRGQKLSITAPTAALARGKLRWLHHLPLRWRVHRASARASRHGRASLPRVKWVKRETMVKRATCPDCGTKEGQLHILGCDQECCPFCGNQLLSCPCGYKKLRIAPDAWAWPHRRTDAQRKKWEKLLGRKGRIPFIQYPLLCAKCGTHWPEMFHVSDAEWKHYVDPRMQRKLLCEACYIQIKAWIDGEGLGLTRRSKQTKRATSRARG